MDNTRKLAGPTFRSSTLSPPLLVNAHQHITCLLAIERVIIHLSECHVICVDFLLVSYEGRLVQMFNRNGIRQWNSVNRPECEVDESACNDDLLTIYWEDTEVNIRPLRDLVEVCELVMHHRWT